MASKSVVLFCCLAFLAVVQVEGLGSLYGRLFKDEPRELCQSKRSQDPASTDLDPFERVLMAVTADREKNKRQSPCYENPQYSGYCTTFSSFCEQETWSNFRTTANRNMFLELCCCQTFK
ncbi:uncharacterized protein [Acropora muricata]|uniref:uncharacterized protein n=1 Tax=Acropora muricata TaxID=159855 RepID=UPI0034E4250D